MSKDPNKKSPLPEEIDDQLGVASNLLDKKDDWLRSSNMHNRLKFAPTSYMLNNIENA